jgi:hypothetical protein
MPLLETLMLDVGGSIARALLKRWLGDNPVSDTASSLSDLLKGRLSDRLAQQRARHQFEAIGEKVGESLLPLFEMEGAGLDEGSRTAIALAVASTLNAATSTLLARYDLEPIEIARQLLQDHPASSCHFSDTEERLYERTISESCQYIVDIATQLPHFTERTLAEVLIRERHLLEIAERVVREVTRLRAELTPQIETARFELDYRRAVVRTLDELELFGSGMSITSRKYSLDLAYVALSLEHQVLRPLPTLKRRLGFSADEENEQSQMVRTITDIATVLEESSYLLLLGDAGSGKTTLMQWIAVRSASRIFPQRRALWNEAVPFFIRLRQHIRAADENRARWPAPEMFPALIAPAIAGAMPHGWVHRQLQEGRAIVLIDGVDEVPAAQRPEVYAWLGDLLATYPRARFIVTSRPYAVHKDDLPAGERLREASVLPLDLSAIEAFVQQWHRAVAANLQDMCEQQELYDAARRLIAGIRANRVQQQLATNPLLCAMLCALHRERHQRLPSSRVALYEACCELLIERRDQERRISLADYPAAELSYEQKRLLLADLAYWLVRNGQTEAPVEVVDERLTRRLGGMVGTSRDLQGRDARLLFVERCGVLREPARGMIDFAHRTLQEFLAARAVVDENDIPLLVQHAHDDLWREVVLLTAGLASRSVRENLVERLLKRGGTRKRFRSRLHLLAAACTQAAPEEMKIEILSRVRQGLVDLVPLQSVEEVVALASTGSLAIPSLAPCFAYSPQVAVACVRVLLQLGSEEALNALLAYITDDTPDVVEALVLGLQDARDRPAYAQRFLSHIKEVRGSPALLPLLTFLPGLTTLRLSRLSVGTDLSVLAQMARLTELSLSGLPTGTDLSVLAQMVGLTDLRLSGLPAGTDLSMLAQMARLTSLGLFNVPAGTDLSVVAQMAGLTTLGLYNLPVGTDLSVLAELVGLTELSLSDLPTGTDLSVVAQMAGLTTLGLYNLPVGTDLSVLAELVGLTELSLSDLPVGTDLSVLAELTGLTSLSLYNLPVGTDLSVLAELTGLTSLSLYNLAAGTDLSVLAQLPRLTTLGLFNVVAGTDLSVLAELAGLTTLELSNVAAGTDLSVLAQLARLTTLELFNVVAGTDLSVLAELAGLTDLWLFNVPAGTDLSVLEQLARLKSVTVSQIARGCIFPEDILKRIRIRRSG